MLLHRKDKKKLFTLSISYLLNFKFRSKHAEKIVITKRKKYAIPQTCALLFQEKIQ